MVNYYAAARTNYVFIKDMDGLKKALEPFDVSVETKFPGADPRKPRLHLEPRWWLADVGL